MVRLVSSIFALLAVSSAVLATSRTTSPAWLGKRADKVTGCTCCGYDVSFGSDMNNMKTYFILNWAGGAGSSNTGYCFLDGELESEFVDMIHEAVATGKSNTYVNATGALTKCAMMGWAVPDQCAQKLVEGYSNFIVGPDGTYVSEWVHTDCAYPADNFTPTDCYCSWECNAGFTRCGNSCIDPAVSQCQSGMPAPKARRSSIPVCDAGAELCPVPLRGFECLDISSDLEACGACPFQPGSVDCTTLPGAEGVACASGHCDIQSCAAGWTLVNGECQVE